jgi:hypothetical protein
VLCSEFSHQILGQSSFKLYPAVPLVLLGNLTSIARALAASK